MTTSLYNSDTGNFRICTIKEIRAVYFSGMSQHTFLKLFSHQHKEDLSKIGFTSFKGYQNPQVVHYIVEQVGKFKIMGNNREC